jgi:hypothetical protein
VLKSFGHCLDGEGRKPLDALVAKLEGVKQLLRRATAHSLGYQHPLLYYQLLQARSRLQLPVVGKACGDGCKGRLTGIRITIRVRGAAMNSCSKAAMSKAAGNTQLQWKRPSFKNLIQMQMP